MKSQRTHVLCANNTDRKEWLTWLIRTSANNKQFSLCGNGTKAFFFFLAADLEVFKTFICSIFYIGKGKRSRPYCHLYDAVSKMNKVNVKMSAKEKQIVDIWNAGLGVVSLHCFQSVIPVEAYTREACMIQAIGVCKLTNMKQGDFYGAPSSWTVAKRRKLGVYLLKKALQIFLAEGERQICLPDLK